MSDSSVAHWGNPVVESLENFFGLHITDLVQKLRTDLATAKTRGFDLLSTVEHLHCDEFLELYLNQQHSRPIERIGGTDLPEGHLRAAFTGRELVHFADDRRRTIFLDGKHLGRDRLPVTLSVTQAEVKAALCYAHDVVLEDPFDDEQNLPEFVHLSRETTPGNDIRLAPDPELFVANVSAVAKLASLAREGVVRFSPRTLAMNPRAIGTFGSNAWHLDHSPEAPDRELVDRMMRVWLLSGGTIVPVFSGERQERRFAETLGVLSEAMNRTEAARLRRLGQLALPTAEGLDMQHMLSIRAEPAFLMFRSRQRAVLTTLAHEPNDARAASSFREEMRAAADEVTVKTRRKVFAQALSPRLMGWGVGGIVGAAFDWRAAAAVLAAVASSKLADFMTASGAQAVVDAPSRGRRALHHHYATLGKPPVV